MILQALICGAIFAIGSATIHRHGQLRQSISTIPPLQDLYEVVQEFPTVNFCNRTFTSNWWIGRRNVRMVTFNGPINIGETSRGLCTCFINLIDQKDWLRGGGKNCRYHRRNNTVTLEFSGKPDPTYNPNAKPTLDRPLKKMKVIAEQFEDNTQMFGVRCRSNWIEDKCKCLHVTIECPIHLNTDAEKFCRRIIDYFNQKTDNGKGWLQDSITQCYIRGSVLDVEFIGNTKEGVVCTAPKCYERKLTSSIVVVKN